MEAKSVKLSSVMQDIIRKMRDEKWELKMDTLFQKARIVSPQGYTQRVIVTTLDGLVVRGLVKYVKYKDHTKFYSLTELGRTINID